MKKVLLTVTSGVLIALVSFNANSLSEKNLEIGMAEETGLTRVQARNALEAYEQQIKSELAAKRGVSMTHATYLPKASKMSDQERDYYLSTNKRNYTSSLFVVKDSPVVTQNVLEAGMSARNGMSVEDNHRLLEAYKKTIEAKGGTKKGFYTKIEKPYYYYNYKNQK
jgi:hypothetical protein